MHTEKTWYITLRGVIRKCVGCIKSTYKLTGTINGTLHNGRKKSATRITTTKAATVIMRSVNCDGSKF